MLTPLSDLREPLDEVGNVFGLRKPEGELHDIVGQFAEELGGPGGSQGVVDQGQHLLRPLVEPRHLRRKGSALWRHRVYRVERQRTPTDNQECGQ